MKRIMITMFGILAVVPVSMLTMATASASPYPGYTPPPWVRPPAMPQPAYRVPAVAPRYVPPMAPYTTAHRFRPAPAPQARMIGPGAKPWVAQRRTPMSPPVPFTYQRGRAPAPALATRHPRAPYQHAQAPMPGYTRTAPARAPVPAWRPGWPVARQALPPRHFYPGLANFRPQYRFAQAPAQARFWKPAPPRTQTSRYFRPPVMQQGSRRLARAPMPPRAHAAPPVGHMAWQTSPGYQSAPVRSTSVWPSRYNSHSAPGQDAMSRGRFRPYPSVARPVQQTGYGTRPVSYGYGSRW